MTPFAPRLKESCFPLYSGVNLYILGEQEIKMNLYRRIVMLSLALAVATTGVCFSQAAPKKTEIYSESADAHAEIKEALQKAAAEHKRVIVVFGANWCYDCHVLDTAFHRSDLAPILSANYEVVHVDIGKGEKNQDLMRKYEVPMKRGIPGLAVLDGDGKLVYSQKNGEFENARALAPEDFLSFLNKWKPAAQSR
jgi:thiol:disulfide interchange protein